MHKYRLISKIGEGTFSEVLKAQSVKNGKYFAIKCMKNHFDSLDQVNNLREIQALRRLSPHANVVKLFEVLFDKPTGRLALVFELMDMNIYELIRGRRHHLSETRVKGFMYQLMKSMEHMHRNGVFHRDIKPENILIAEDVLKVADFGSCRGIYSKPPYTEYISTRWYRAPECLLTDGYYGHKMDIWGAGSVMFEVLALYPLFPGKNELDQIEKVHNILGSPSQSILRKFKRYASHVDFNFAPKKGSGIASLLRHVSGDCVSLLKSLLAYDPEDRISARQALKHPWFDEIRMKESIQSPVGASITSPSVPLKQTGVESTAGSTKHRSLYPTSQQEEPVARQSALPVVRQQPNPEPVKMPMKIHHRKAHHRSRRARVEVEAEETLPMLQQKHVPQHVQHHHGHYSKPNIKFHVPLHQRGAVKLAAETNYSNHGGYGASSHVSGSSWKSKYGKPKRTVLEKVKNERYPVEYSASTLNVEEISARHGRRRRYVAGGQASLVSMKIKQHRSNYLSPYSQKSMMMSQHR